MNSRLICIAPLPEAVAQRALVQFDAVLSQDREMAIENLLLTLREQTEIVAVLTSSRIRFDAIAIAALPPQVKILALNTLIYQLPRRVA